MDLGLDFDLGDIEKLSREERERVALILDELAKRHERRQFFRLFPDEDAVQPNGSIIHARHKYPKHLDFFAAGKRYRERAFMAANRIGKTTGGSYELTAHLTGLYPDWWEGRRFQDPVRCWAAGKTNETTRDIVQAALLGEVRFEGTRKSVTGTGMIPGHLLGLPAWKQGVQDLADTIKVRHVSGGWSTLGFKSFQQGRGSFEGTAQHVIWLDEECPLDVYGECLVRTATTNGIVLLTVTPLEGLTEIILEFMPAEHRPKH